jgi:uncharacterized OB-fold protein
MLVSTCKCGRIVIFKRELCPNCGRSMNSIEIGNDASILTYTTLYTVPEGFNSPVYLVLVELKKGVKLLCECKNEADLEIDRKGKIVVDNDKYFFVGNTD